MFIQQQGLACPWCCTHGSPELVCFKRCHLVLQNPKLNINRSTSNLVITWPVPKQTFFAEAPSQTASKNRLWPDPCLAHLAALCH